MRIAQLGVRCRLVLALIGGLGTWSLGLQALADKPAAEPVHLTLEVAWQSQAAGDPAAPSASASGPEVGLAMAEGRVMAARRWPARSGSAGNNSPIVQAADGQWLLGSATSGRVRLRLEAPITDELTVQVADQSQPLSLATLLEGPWQSPESWPVALTMRRLPWDTLELAVSGEAAEGVVEPGARVPLTVGFNVLTPEATAVELTLTTKLKPIRGDQTLWRNRSRLVVETNRSNPPSQTVTVPMPTEEGTYTIEWVATWRPRSDPNGSSRLGRWLRRLRGRSEETARRRISLAVVRPGADPRPPQRWAPEGSDQVVDLVQLGRSRGLRLHVSGRHPTEDAGTLDSAWSIPTDLLLDEPNRRERLRDLLNLFGSELKPLPPANAEGLAWTAVALKVPKPDRPHRLDLNVLGGDPSALSIGLLAPSNPPRLLLDAQGSGPMLPKGSAPITLSWPVWPDTSEPILIVVNRSPDQPLWLGDARLTELAEEPAPLPVISPPGPGRSLAVRLTRPTDLARFGGVIDDGPDDPLARARHLAAYLASVGASAVVLPPSESDRDRRSGLQGQAVEDAIGPDRRLVLRRILDRHRIDRIAEVRFDQPALPGLPPAGSEAAERRGLALIGPSGQVDPKTKPRYNLLHPDVQAAVIAHVLSALNLDENAGHDALVGSGLDGLLLRLGPGPTLAGRPETGLDDTTYARFVSDVIKGGQAPGLGTDAPDRFAKRLKFLSGPALVPWQSWRSRRIGSFYAKLSQAIFERAPGTSLFVATPGPDDGPAGSEAHRCDREGLPPDAAWRAVGLNLKLWPESSDAPIVLRGVGLDVDDLAGDLATHPALDQHIRKRPIRGLLLGLDEALAESAQRPKPAPGLQLSAVGLSPGTRGVEPLGHAIAALDAQWIVVSGSAMAGQEDRLRQFARTFRALPEPGSEAPPLPPSGTVVRSRSIDGQTYLTVANDTPYPVQMRALIQAPASVPVENLGQGRLVRTEPTDNGRQLIVDLGPFGVEALRLATTEAQVVSSVPVFDPMRQAHHDAIAHRLRQLSQSGSIAHLNPGFEPESAVRRTANSDDEPTASPLAGWTARGAMDASVVLDQSRAHSGRGSLRLDTPTAPAALVSQPFRPPGPVANLRASLRTEPAEAPIQVWLESPPGATHPVRLSAQLPEKDRFDWQTMALRAPGLPTEGSTQVRLRIALQAPGKLWVDDLAITGPGLSQARSRLTAALHAYDEGRFADFARLATSHWVIEALGPGAGTVSRPLDSPATNPAGEPIQTGDASEATDLPDSGRLR